MGNQISNNINCFISAPFGTDLTVIKNILNSSNIATTDQSAVEIGMPITESVRKSIEKSNFVCALIPTNTNCENTYFDIGIAFAKNKPLLILFGFDTNIPIFLKNLVAVKVNFNNNESIKLAIESFIKYNLNTYIIDKKYEKVIKKPLSYEIIKEHQQINKTSEIKLQESITQILKDSGYNFESQYRIKKDEKVFSPDIALWIEELQNIFINPILVEIKIFKSPNKQLFETENQVNRYLNAIGGNCGIIIYSDINGIKYPYIAEDMPKQPLIIRFEVDEFVNLIINHKLEKKLIDIRNNIAHGRL